MSDHGFGSDTPPPPPPPPPPKDEGAGGRGGAKDGADNPYEDAGGSPGQETAREETRAEDKSGNRSEDAAGDENGTLDQESPKPLPPSDEGVEDQGRPKDGADDPFDEDAHRSPVQETSEAAVDGAEDNDEVTDNDKAAAAAPDATETRTEDTETAPPATDPPTEGGPSPTEDDRPSSPPTEANRPSAAAEDDAQDPPEKKPDAPADTQQGDASTSPGDTDEPGPSETPDHIPEQRQDPDRTTRPEPDGEPASMDGATETVGEGPQSAETIEDADQVPGVPEPESVETDRSPEDPATTDAEQHTPPSRDVPQPADGAGDTGPDHSTEQVSEPQVPEQPGTPAHPDHSTESRPEGSQQPQRESGDPEGSVPSGSTDQPAAPAVDTDGDAAGAGIAVGVEGLGKAAVATVEVAGKVAAGLAMENGAAASEAQADIKPDGDAADGDNGGVRDEGGDSGGDAAGVDADTGEQSPKPDGPEPDSSDGSAVPEPAGGEEKVPAADDGEVAAGTAEDSGSQDEGGDEADPADAGRPDERHYGLTSEQRESIGLGDDSPHLARIAELDQKQGGEGHAPGRHLYPRDETLQRRLGSPAQDGQGQPVLYGPNTPYPGHIKSTRNNDPMWEPHPRPGNYPNGGQHKVGAYSTRFDQAADVIAVDEYFRSRITPEGALPQSQVPISTVLGPDGHERMTGFYRDPANPSEFLPVDFEGGTFTPTYGYDDGQWKCVSIYPNPAPGRHP